jgi:hypothetical protein
VQYAAFLNASARLQFFTFDYRDRVQVRDMEVMKPSHKVMPQHIDWQHQ